LKYVQLSNEGSEPATPTPTGSSRFYFQLIKEVVVH